MPTGMVKWFDARKGYGFIEQESGDDVFVHFSALPESGGFRTLNDGEEVEFEVTEGPKGLQASNVVRLNPPPPGSGGPGSGGYRSGDAGGAPGGSAGDAYGSTHSERKREY